MLQKFARLRVVIDNHGNPDKLRPGILQLNHAMYALSGHLGHDNKVQNIITNMVWGRLAQGMHKATVTATKGYLFK